MAWLTDHGTEVIKFITLRYPQRLFINISWTEATHLVNQGKHAFWHSRIMLKERREFDAQIQYKMHEKIKKGEMILKRDVNQGFKKHRLMTSVALLHVSYFFTVLLSGVPSVE